MFDRVLLNTLLLFTVGAGFYTNGISMITALKLLALLPVLTVSSTLLAAPSDFALSADLGSTRQAGDGESGTAFSGSVGLSYQITPTLVCSAELYRFW